MRGFFAENCVNFTQRHFRFQPDAVSAVHRARNLATIDGRHFRKWIGKDLASYLHDHLIYAIRQADMFHILKRTLGQLRDAGL